MNTNNLIHCKPEFRTIRLKKGLSLRDIAARAGVTPAVLSRLENGRSIMPKTAKGICEVLNVSFDDIFQIKEKNNVR